MLLVVAGAFCVAKIIGISAELIFLEMLLQAIAWSNIGIHEARACME
jgi:hypothetical protein